MFFTPELLARRDGGFGLLWLAATLGSKSTFKKLPKRSILTADIAKLCDLIAQPTEPLALRLSSNLMVGVARVYKVKQDIFMTDVTNCVASLKKVVQEHKSTMAPDPQLQMAQPSVRSSTLTLVADPSSTLFMDFDALVANWDQYLNIGAEVEGEADSNLEHFDLNVRKERNRALPHTEVIRAEQYTLVEHHEHLLSSSLDRSYDEGAIDRPSSQAEATFGFEDNFFAFSDELDIGALADELEKELGWDASQTKNENIPMEVDNAARDLDCDLDHDLIFNDLTGSDYDGKLLSSAFNAPRRFKRKTPELSGKENRHPTPLLQLEGVPTPQRFSSAISFSQSLLLQDERLPSIDITTSINKEAILCRKKFKRTRLLLDVRTELTDDELKTARTQYLQFQDTLRRAIDFKQFEKEKTKMVEEMVWGTPSRIQAPALADFWRGNFKVQVDTRSGLLHLHPREEPPKKRRKTRDAPHTPAGEASGGKMNSHDLYIHTGVGSAMGVGRGLDDGVLVSDHGDDGGRRLHSSEEPGQGRHASLLQGFDFDMAPIGSQKSSLFPWDNAGGDSSSGVVGMPGSDRLLYVDHVDTRLRGSSLGRRDDSLVPSQPESLVGAPGFSPALVRAVSQTPFEDYAFEVLQPKYVVANGSQRSNDTNLVSLERNSFNFLEYVKMQLHSLPSSISDLNFNTIAPRKTSTRQVAATAFYHCLGAFFSCVIHCFSIDRHRFEVIWVCFAHMVPYSSYSPSYQGLLASQATRSLRPIIYCNDITPNGQALGSKHDNDRHLRNSTTDCKWLVVKPLNSSMKNDALRKLAVPSKYHTLVFC